jgi:GNAT superfamily N-acetyltransferase
VTSSAEGLVMRRATPGDRGAILELARRSLGWPPGPESETYFRWKHDENPFGGSVVWVAEADGRIVGLRTFLRWELVDATGAVKRVVRAVDAATDPDFHRRGIFTGLTLAALDELRAEGVDFVFNAPNHKSLAGNLKLGWSVVGRLPVAIRPTGVVSLVRVARARATAERGALPTPVGVPAASVFDDAAITEALLAHVGPAPHLGTRRDQAYLAWRFGPPPLRYRVMLAPGGVEHGGVVFHLRRRGAAVEAVVCEELVRDGDRRTVRELCRRIAAETAADFLLRLRQPGEGPAAAGFLALPRLGPVLAARVVNSQPPADLSGWALTMGDMELF